MKHRTIIFFLSRDKFLDNDMFCILVMKHCTFLLLLLFMIGCSNASKNQKATVAEDKLIQLTQEQFESGKMQIAEISDQYFNEEVKCNGYITAPVNGIAQISTPISGIVEKISCSLNDYVREGQAICQLSSNELMTLQNDFAETSARLIRLSSDYDRIKTLFNEDIGAKKEFIAIESEYKAMKAKNLSTKMRLEHLGLDVSRIEDGRFYGTFPVIAPISGHVISHNIALGQYTEPQKILAEIVDVNQLQLLLSVFENDINKLKIGQDVRFLLLKEPGSAHPAILTSIGRAIDPESKTIPCIAKIKDAEGTHLINQSYIEALISVDKIQAPALPNDALLKSGRDSYVLAVDKFENLTYYLRKIKVDIGRKSKDFSEILNIPSGTKVLAKGAYYLNRE
jgi:membrane fusion protein, heavy metal efflux system